MKKKSNGSIKRFFALLVLCSFFLPLSAQYQTYYDEEYGADNGGKFFIAPDFGLLLGTVTRIEISPALGYYLTNRLSFALGGRYEYIKDSRDYFYYNSYSTNIYGMRAYTELDVIQDLDKVIPLRLHVGIFGHLEYEGLSLERQYFDPVNQLEGGRFWHSTALIGAGLRQPAGQRVSFNVTFLWDTDSSSRSLYSNPIMRIGFQIFLK